jgi:hypothetical protein
MNEPKPLISVRRATEDAIEYEIVCYVSSLGKKIEVRNALFDLAHRHLSSRGVMLRPLSVPQAMAQTVDEAHRLLRNVSIFHSLVDTDVTDLVGKLTHETYEPGDTIYAARGGESPALYIVATAGPRGFSRTVRHSCGRTKRHNGSGVDPREGVSAR